MHSFDLVYCRRQGGPSEPAEMLEAMQTDRLGEPRHSAPLNRWSDGQVALGIRCIGSQCMGNQSECVDQDATESNLPAAFHDATLGLTVAATVRLDNRDTLCSQLDIASDQRRHLSDHQLLLHAYARWGREMPKQLLGDFALAIWDRKKHTLFCARDAVGVRPFYYSLNRERFIASDDWQALLVRPGVGEQINAKHVAQTLQGWQGAPLPPETTVLKTVRRLLPGHAMIVTAEHEQLWPWWQPQDVAALRMSQPQAYVAALRDLLEEAVGCHMGAHNHMGTLLSGGLDSSALTVLAAAQAQKLGHNLPLFFWSEQANDGYLPNDERQRVDQLTQQLSLTCHYVSPTIADAAYTRIRSAGSPVGTYRVRPLHRKAQELGVSTILSGLGGNTVISAKGDTLGDPGDWWFFGQAMGQAALSADGRRIKGLLSRHVRTPIRHRKQQRQMEQRQIEMWPTLLAMWQPALQIEMQTPLEAEPYPSGVRARQLHRLGRYQLGATMEAYHAATLANGISYRFPWLDRRVVEFGLGIPSDLYEQDGLNRWIFRQALAGTLPHEIRLHRGGGEPAISIDRRRINLGYNQQIVVPLLTHVAAQKRTWQAMNPDGIQAYLAQAADSIESTSTPELLAAKSALSYEMLLDPAFDGMVRQWIEHRPIAK
ncbi:MAG: asparagine synthase-related protein [Chloroflexota bacterium]